MGTPSALTLDPPAGDPPTAPAPSMRWWQGALAGLAAAGVALGVAQLVSGLIRGTTSPVVSVGEWVIDHVPVAVKDFAIRQFGTNDKPMLILAPSLLLGCSPSSSASSRSGACGSASSASPCSGWSAWPPRSPDRPLRPARRCRPPSARWRPWRPCSSCSRGSRRPRPLERTTGSTTGPTTGSSGLDRRGFLFATARGESARRSPPAGSAASSRSAST